MVGLGLPLNLYDLEFLTRSPKPALYIVGTRDEFCSQENLDRFEHHLPSSASVRRIENADHFFTEQADIVQNLISDFFLRLPPRTYCYMKKSIYAVVLVFAVWCSDGSFGAPPRFTKVSDHCYYLQLKESGENVAAVITDNGILMVNPPQEPDLSIAIEALATMTSKSVRWIVFTEPGFSRAGYARVFTDRNALILAAARLQALSLPENAPLNGNGAAVPSPPRLIFEGQMHLFPSNVEVRIIALQHKARTGGDVVVFVPAEKVLFVGGLYEVARYPDIDRAAGGSPVDWMDGMKQVIDSVPVLKSAIPAAKPRRNRPNQNRKRRWKKGSR